MLDSHPHGCLLPVPVPPGHTPLDTQPFTCLLSASQTLGVDSRVLGAWVTCTPNNMERMQTTEIHPPERSLMYPRLSLLLLRSPNVQGHPNTGWHEEQSDRMLEGAHQGLNGPWIKYLLFSRMVDHANTLLAELGRLCVWVLERAAPFQGEAVGPVGIFPIGPLALESQPHRYLLPSSGTSRDVLANPLRRSLLSNEGMTTVLFMAVRAMSRGQSRFPGRPSCPLGGCGASGHSLGPSALLRRR